MKSLSQKEFVWQLQQTDFRFQATENAKSFLQDAQQPLTREFGVNHLEEELQGKQLDLGQHRVKIENATITNAEQIAKELEQLDGHDFPVYVYAPSGAATFHFLQTPTPPTSFDQLTQEFIDLEGQLVDLFFASVNQLAAASIDEETALEQERLLTELSFNFSEDDDPTSTSIN